ncbi:unnamed protein product, partial [Gulo gulo]
VLLGLPLPSAPASPSQPKAGPHLLSLFHFLPGLGARERMAAGPLALFCPLVDLDSLTRGCLENSKACGSQSVVSRPSTSPGNLLEGKGSNSVRLPPGGSTGPLGLTTADCYRSHLLPCRSPLGAWQLLLDRTVR